MHILLNNGNNTTEKSDDASEGMSTPQPKTNKTVGREVEEEESGSDRNGKGLCSVV